MKTAKALATVFIAIVLCGYLGFCCSNITNPPPKPWILFDDTNKTNPDTTSFQNCEWSQSDKSIIPKDKSRSFSFGYLFKGSYNVMYIDSTKHANFDDSTAFWGFVGEDGKAYSYFPFQVKKTPVPTNAKFLRPVSGLNGNVKTKAVRSN